VADVAEAPVVETADESVATSPADSRRHEIVWLTPANCSIRLGDYNELLVERMDAESDGTVHPLLRRRDLAHGNFTDALLPETSEAAPSDTENASPQLRGAFVVCTFPASRPEEFLSLRAWDEKGDENEIGMIRSLSDWPEDVQHLVKAAIRRRYLLRRIESIHRLDLAHGFLECDVQTDRGREQFTMRWSQSQAQDFGEHGKLIIDTEDNRYVIPNVDALPKPDRIKFRQHIYW
jgi:hypothetical protein